MEEIIDKSLPRVGDVMSNFDHEIDREIEMKLKQGDCYADYPAYNFHANVWYNNKKFQCQIWRYHSLVEVIEAETLDEIMEEASAKWGWQ